MSEQGKVDLLLMGCGSLREGRLLMLWHVLLTVKLIIVDDFDSKSRQVGRRRRRKRLG